MNAPIKIVLIVCTFLFSVSSKAQNYNDIEFSYLNAENGLNSNECNFVFQDTSGLIWVGTNEGLSRYDGQEAINFGMIVNDDSFSIVKFYMATEDDAFNIWFATSIGLLKFNKRDNEVINITDNFRKDGTNSQISIETLTYDSSGKIWFGGFEGLYQLDLNSGKITDYGSGKDKQHSFEKIKHILYSKNGDIWIAAWGRGIAKYDPVQDQFIAFEIFTSGPKMEMFNVISSLLEDSKGNLWVGSWSNGLYVLDVQSENPKILHHFYRNGNSKNSIIGNIIYDLNEDQFGNIWIGTPYGMSILENGMSQKARFYNYDYNQSNQALSNNEVMHIMKDQTGLLWLATVGGGVNIVDIEKNKFSTYKITEVDSVIKSQSVYSFTKDPKGRLLVGVQGLGFGVYDLESESFQSYSQIEDYKALMPTLINTVKNFTWDNGGNLWLGTRLNGLISFNLKSKAISVFNQDTKLKKHSFRTVTKTVTDTRGRIWALTDRGIFYLDASIEDGFEYQNLRYFHPLNDMSPNATLDIAIDKEGMLYQSNLDGNVYKSVESVYENIENPTFTVFSKSTSIPVSIHIDKSDRLWITTEKDITIYPLNDHSKSKTALTGFKGLKIFSFAEDEHGNYLASSNQGLIHIQESEGEFLANFYTARNGLQGNVFIKEAMFKDKNFVFVGGHSGFNSVNMNSLEIDKTNPKVLLTSLNTSNKAYFSADLFDTNNPFVIDYDDNLISFSFSSLDLRAPDMIKYAYKMEGLDQEWNYVSANNRSATYVNLKPGKYTFRIKATNVSGIWSDQEAVLPIYVKTAPYFTWWAYLIYALIAVSILTFIFLLYRRHNKAKQSLRLEHLERSKSEKLHQFKLQFFTNLSHELLTPLSVLMIIAEKWKSKSKGEENKDSKTLSRNINKLYEHLMQMLNFRKAETGNMLLKTSFTELNPIFEGAVENYKVIADEKEITFNFEVEEIIKGDVDVEKLEICLNNLLSNAFKYTKPKGEVDLSISQVLEDDLPYLIVKVKDTGIGIPKKAQGKIFNRFHRLSSEHHFEDGLGIGLALTKNLVDIQNGSIWVNSEVNKGSEFGMKIPLVALEKGISGQNQPIFSDFVDDLELPNYRETHQKLEFTGKTILVVEDNPDFSSLIENHLLQYYHVFVCSNGKEALKIANTKEVDLIVSDLLMPEMDGYELCKTIKSEVNTSHVPFIMLTARSEDEERIIAYEIGADSYLTKPLNLEVLTFRIQALLKNRENIHSEFNAGAYLEPEKIVTTSIDEEFLRKAKEIVEANISDPDFNVKTLYEELAMSNSMFYRKIKGILNLTPNEFIKNIRLRRAAQLLDDKEIHISEVAFQAGFNDLSYFGVCFKKQYGITPTQYQKENSNSNNETVIS